MHAAVVIHVRCDRRSDDHAGSRAQGWAEYLPRTVEAGEKPELDSAVDPRRAVDFQSADKQIDMPRKKALS